jgi:hypothetical protein
MSTCFRTCWPVYCRGDVMRPVFPILVSTTPQSSSSASPGAVESIQSQESNVSPCRQRSVWLPSVSTPSRCGCVNNSGSALGGVDKESSVYLENTICGVAYGKVYTIPPMTAYGRSVDCVGTLKRAEAQGLQRQSWLIPCPRTNSRHTLFRKT